MRWVLHADILASRQWFYGVSASITLQQEPVVWALLEALDGPLRGIEITSAFRRLSSIEPGISDELRVRDVLRDVNKARRGEGPCASPVLRHHHEWDTILRQLMWRGVKCFEFCNALHTAAG